MDQRYVIAALLPIGQNAHGIIGNITLPIMQNHAGTYP
jgi:hypothetical protein